MMTRKALLSAGALTAALFLAPGALYGCKRGAPKPPVTRPPIAPFTPNLLELGAGPYLPDRWPVGTRVLRVWIQPLPEGAKSQLPPLIPKAFAWWDNALGGPGKNFDFSFVEDPSIAQVHVLWDLKRRHRDGDTSQGHVGYWTQRIRGGTGDSNDPTQPFLGSVVLWAYVDADPAKLLHEVGHVLLLPDLRYGLKPEMPVGLVRATSVMSYPRDLLVPTQIDLNTVAALHPEMFEP